MSDSAGGATKRAPDGGPFLSSFVREENSVGRQGPPPGAWGERREANPAETDHQHRPGRNFGNGSRGSRLSEVDIVEFTIMITRFARSSEKAAYGGAGALVKFASEQ